MDTLELKSIIDNILSDAFDRIEYAYQHHREPKEKESIEIGNNPRSRLVFPSYSSPDAKLTGEARVCEQELRFAFVEAFNTYCENHKLDYFYSIETPTRRRYKGFSKGKPDVIKKGKKGGRSAEFDLVVFDKNLKRVCLIEFKARSVKSANYKKDILKLVEDRKDLEECSEKGVLSYFINLFESSNAGTINTMKEKIKEFVKNKNYMNEEDIFIWYYVLGSGNKEPWSLKDISL